VNVKFPILCKWLLLPLFVYCVTGFNLGRLSLFVDSEQALTYQREYRKRREANGGQPLGHFEGKRPDERAPEEIAAAEAERTARLKAYHAKWYQDNKVRMKAEQDAKRAAMTPEERAEASKKRTASRREYEKGYRERNREKMNAYARDWKKKQREQKAETAM